jgi:hypothetical protein
MRGLCRALGVRSVAIKILVGLIGFEFGLGSGAACLRTASPSAYKQQRLRMQPAGIPIGGLPPV